MVLIVKDVICIDEMPKGVNILFYVLYSLNILRKIFAVEPDFVIMIIFVDLRKIFLIISNKYFKVKIFTAWDKTMKSVKTFCQNN